MEPPAFIHPGGTQQKQIGIHGTGLPQHRENVSFVVVERKPAHLGVGFAFVIAVHLRGVVARTQADAADAKTHFRGVEQFPQQLLAGGRGELVQHVAGRIRKRGPKAQNLLIPHGRIEDHGVGGRATLPPPLERRFPSQSLRSRRQPDLDVPSRCACPGWRLRRGGAASDHGCDARRGQFHHEITTTL